VDTFSRDFGDVEDLDELMTRVREAALGTGSSSVTVAEVSAETPAGDSDLIRVIDAQSQLNEHLRKTLAELVECLQTLRDDWGEAHKGLRHEMGRLSALVGTMPMARGAAGARRKPSSAAARGRRTMASRRTTRARRATKGARKRP